MTSEDLEAVKDVQCDSASNLEICKIGACITLIKLLLKAAFTLVRFMQ